MILGFVDITGVLRSGYKVTRSVTVDGQHSWYSAFATAATLREARPVNATCLSEHAEGALAEEVAIAVQLVGARGCARGTSVFDDSHLDM